MITSPLTRADLRTAHAALCYFRRAHVLSCRPVPEAVDILAAHIEQALAANGQPEPPTPQDWLTTSQVAQRLNCSTRTALRIAKRVGHRKGRIWLVPADAVEEDTDDG